MSTRVELVNLESQSHLGLFDIDYCVSSLLYLVFYILTFCLFDGVSLLKNCWVCSYI